MRTKEICVVALLLLFLTGMPVMAQEEERKEGDDLQKDAPHEIPKPVAEEQARTLEDELVRMVQALLAKARHQGTGQRTQKVEQPRKAKAPEPAKHDRTVLLNEIAEWKSKNLAMVEVSREQQLAALRSRYEQAKKKLDEKFRKRERIVVDPKRRPPAARERENEELERAYNRELEELDKEFETEKRKIEKESGREAESVERLANELEKAILSGQSRGKGQRR